MTNKRKRRLFNRLVNNVSDLFKREDELIKLGRVARATHELLESYSLEYLGNTYKIELERTWQGKISCSTTITSIKLPQYPGNEEASDFVTEFFNITDSFYRYRSELEANEENPMACRFDFNRWYAFPSLSDHFDSTEKGRSNCNRQTRKLIDYYIEHKSNIETILKVIDIEYPQTKEEVSEIVRRFNLPFTLLGNYQSPHPFSHCIYAERTPPFGGLAKYPKWVLMEVVALGNPEKEESIRKTLLQMREESGDIPRDETTVQYEFTPRGLCVVGS